MEPDIRYKYTVNVAIDSVCYALGYSFFTLHLFAFCKLGPLKKIGLYLISYWQFIFANFLFSHGFTDTSQD